MGRPSTTISSRLPQLWFFFLFLFFERGVNSSVDLSVLTVTLDFAQASPPKMVSHLQCNRRCRFARVVPRETLQAQIVDNNRVHRRSHVGETHFAMYAGISLALATESCRRSCTSSSAQRPPVSMPRTTSLQRLTVSSGCVLPLFVSSSLKQHCPICVRSVGVCFARTRQWGSQCDVDCQLSPRKTWEILCQHLDASAISCRDITLNITFLGKRGPMHVQWEWHVSSNVHHAIHQLHGHEK